MIKYKQCLRVNGIYIGMKNKFFTAIFVFLVTTGAAFAVNLPDAMKESMSHDYGIPSVMNLVLSMIFVIALIYITGWVYTKLNIVNRKNIGKITESDDNMRFNIIQSMSLGQQRHIYSIEMNNKILLIGSTPSHINLIKEFDKKTFNEKYGKDNRNDYTESVTDIQKTTNIDELYKKYKH